MSLHRLANPSTFRRLVLAFSVAWPAGLLAADADTQLVSTDLVREFTGGIISAGVPTGFPVVTLPAGVNVRVLGSLEVSPYTQQVLLESTQGVDALREALRAAYVAAGWTDLTPTPMLVRLCHDSFGTLQFSTSVQSGSPRLRVLRTSLISSVDPSLTCSQQQASQQNGGWSSYFLALMPALTVPPQTIPATPGLVVRPFLSLSSSSSSSGTSIEMKQDNLIEVPDINIAGLYAHFAARMDEQGWRNDSEGAGTSSATSVWYKTTAAPAYADADAPDTELTGTLTILHTTGNHYRVQFSLQAMLAGQVLSGSNISVRDFILYDQFSGNAPALGIRGIPSGYVR